jgi:hypothetical protein
MAHFAEIDQNNIVLRVIVVSDEHENNGETWCAATFGGTWKQTSYTNKIRKNYAGIGYTYNDTLDAFIPLQPFPSWTLNENCQWISPVPFPANASVDEYTWDESNTSWKRITPPN